jgi:hypothetical protein
MNKRYENNQWKERPANKRVIKVRENFDKRKILLDFFQSFPNAGMD